ncbi:unnamed protein product [Arctia plantaginis]|uniref:Uncharacterized protein n=1 Tax=Arctia plantaginis TaxID=874455 RepID=A0A8S1ABT7_ARCPL|nr:unnamed protein product [Arctia plantaginis]
MLPHKDIHKRTWKSCDGKTVNQFEHVVIDARHKSNIQDVKIYRGTDCDSGYYLVGIKLIAKIKLTSSKDIQREPSINTVKLKDENIAAFNIKISNKAELEDLGDINNLCEKTKQIVKDVGIRICGTEECEKAMDRKKE